MSGKYSGSCDCGAVKYTAKGPLRGVVNCHCSQCRRTHGHVAAYTEAGKKDFVLTEQRGLKWYASSDVARRGFCGECGSSLFWDQDEAEGMCIAAGTLDGPTGLTTVGEIFVDDKSDYYDLIPTLPHRGQG